MDWNKAQLLEAAYWRQHWAVELVKQGVYLRMMGLKPTEWHNKRIADVGGGPLSVCLQMPNDNRRVVVDPIPDNTCECGAKYLSEGIRFDNVPAEQWSPGCTFTDVLIYNCLQHVKDPQTVIDRALGHLQVGGRMWLCEQIGIPPGKAGTNYAECHPHTLEASKLREWVSSHLDMRIERFDLFLDVHPDVTGNWLVLIAEKVDGRLARSDNFDQGLPKRRLRCHVLGIAHTITNKAFCACFSDDTEIMTEEGWWNIKDYIEKKPAIRIATLNAEKDIVEYQAPTMYHKYPFAGRMFHQKSINVDFLVTPDHKLWGRTGADIVQKRPFHLIEAQDTPKVMEYRRDFPWQEGKEEDVFVLPSYRTLYDDGKVARSERPARSFRMDDWLHFLGIFIAEGWAFGTPYKRKDGTQLKTKHCVGIGQWNKANRKTIAGWLDKLGVKYGTNRNGFIISDVQFGTWCAQFGKARDKFIPSRFKNLSKRQLALLLEALLLGDGWKQGDSKRYVSYSRRLANDVSEIGAKLGYAVTMYSDPDPDKPRHIVTLSCRLKTPKLNTQRDNREWFGYAGHVFCVTVPNELVYVRRKGKATWQGNCAYTQKVLNLCKMLKAMGHEVIHYGTEGSEAECDEQVNIVSRKTHEDFYKHWNWREKLFPCYATEGKVFWDEALKNCPKEMEKRITGRHDIVCVTFGWPQKFWTGNAIKPVGPKIVETGIGYKGCFADYRVFETNAWMAWCMGNFKYAAGKAFDAVIWNYYDLDEFTFRDKPEKEDYLCFVARNTPDKGLEVAVNAAKRMGMKIKIAGQRTDANGNFFCPSVYSQPHVEYVGYVNVQQRNELMGKAKALLMPTQYWEPFGGVVIEANLTGTSAITTNWGAYTETVVHGKTGWRCHTMQDFCEAIQRIDEIDPKACRAWAAGNASLEVAQAKYDDWLQRISQTEIDPSHNGYYDAGPYSLEPWKTDFAAIGAQK